MYCITDNPPWHLCILLGIQQFLMMFGGTIAIPFMLAPKLCITDPLDLSELLCTGLFVSGAITILQVLFGVRLPIIQGGTPTFVIPAFAILSLPQWRCPWTGTDQSHGHTNNITQYNITDNLKDIWKPRMCEIQGAIMVASLVQIVVGCTCLVSLLLKVIGPLVIAPTITLIGLSLYEIAANMCEQNWLIAILTMLLIISFSQFMERIKVPCCSRIRRFEVIWIPLFQLFPIILAIIISWGICGILTVTDAIPSDPDHWAFKSRTDGKLHVIEQARWIRVPYPGQWGTPTLSIGGVIGMVAGVLAGIIESIGDYHVCAKLSGAPPPPGHAINRGVFIEGLGCLLAGAFGSGAGTTSYSENVGAIGITKVGSRRVVVYAGCIMMLLGLFNKVAALFVTIPDPIIGGVLMTTFGMITAIGVSNLQCVDMNSSRNLFIFGFSLFFGLSLSEWMKDPVHSHRLQTGNEVFDQVVVILLSTGMFVGGLVAFILDNMVPGKSKQSLSSCQNTDIKLDSLENGDDNLADDVTSSDKARCYDLPVGMSFIHRYQWTKYIPLSPRFNPDYGSICRCNRHHEKVSTEPSDI